MTWLRLYRFLIIAFSSRFDHNVDEHYTSRSMFQFLNKNCFCDEKERKAATITYVHFIRIMHAMLLLMMKTNDMTVPIINPKLELDPFSSTSETKRSSKIHTCTCIPFRKL